MFQLLVPEVPMPVVVPIQVVAAALHLVVAPIQVADPIQAVAVVLHPVKCRNWDRTWFPG